MILYYAIAALHVIVCVILVLVVLLQSGKGADLAGAFGGGATQTAFGSRGPASFLSKMTTIAAVVFMITSIALSMISTKREAANRSSKRRKAECSSPPRRQPAAPPVAVPSREQIEKRPGSGGSKTARQQAAPAATPESAGS